MSQFLPKFRLLISVVVTLTLSPTVAVYGADSDSYCGSDSSSDSGPTCDTSTDGSEEINLVSGCENGTDPL